MTQKSRNDWPINADKASRVKILFILYKFLYICTYILVTNDQFCKQSATKQQQLHNVAFRKAYSLKWLGNKRATRVQSVASLCFEMIQYSLLFLPLHRCSELLLMKIRLMDVLYSMSCGHLVSSDMMWNETCYGLYLQGEQRGRCAHLQLYYLWDLTFGNSFTHIASWNLSWHFFFFFDWSTVSFPNQLNLRTV